VALSFYNLTESDILRELYNEAVPEFVDRVVRLALITLKQPFDPKDWTIRPEKIRRRALRICHLIKRYARKFEK
jgi:hypothetical protein